MKITRALSLEALSPRFEFHMKITLEVFNEQSSQKQQDISVLRFANDFCVSF